MSVVEVIAMVSCDSYGRVALLATLECKKITLKIIITYLKFYPFGHP